MYVGRNFDNSDTEESENYSFDFVNDLLEVGEVINSVTFELSMARSSPIFDPLASAKAIGAPTVNGTIVTQRIAGLVQRGIYHLQAFVDTSTGNTRSLSSYIRVEEQR